jgi:hypothetical protein
MTRLRQMGDTASQSEAWNAFVFKNSACNAIRESQLIFRTDLSRYDYVFDSHWIHEFDLQIASREELREWNHNIDTLKEITIENIIYFSTQMRKFTLLYMFVTVKQSVRCHNLRYVILEEWHYGKS